MILEGNVRGSARELALHLLKEENDHVTVHDMRGFVSDDLESAFKEVQAVSRGTRAKKYLFSLSLNPPPDAKVSTESFEDAIKRVERTLGLEDQPRAVVFHEKNARRHCHAVWSRIDGQAMKAIPLPFTKRKLMDVSRDLYIEHGWDLPKGFLKHEDAQSTNFTLAQWQQARRQGKDPKHIKTTLQNCWGVSHDQNSLQQRLERCGYVLAKGDRRAFVAIDQQCEVYSLPRWIGIKTKDVKAKINEPDRLPSVDESKQRIAENMINNLDRLKQHRDRLIQQRIEAIQTEKANILTQQAQARLELETTHKERQQQEAQQRQARYNKGLRGLLDYVTGKRKAIKQQNEQETHQAELRDRQEKDTLIFQHMEQQRTMQQRIERLENFDQTRGQSLNRDIEQYQQIQQGAQEKFEPKLTP